MKIIKCKRCEADFELQHFNQKYCSTSCFEKNRKESQREYMREYMAKKRETLVFLAKDATEIPSDNTKVAFFRAFGLHDFIHEIAKTNQVIGLQINGNEVGVMIAQDSSED